jgi:Hydrogenase formation hypA family
MVYRLAERMRLTGWVIRITVEERSSRSRILLPQLITLVHGPGCPVCVTRSR